MSINHKYVFDAAKDLRIGSEILGNKFGESVFPLRSTIVTATFSAELYLKCLLYISGKNVPRGRSGHDLKLLYETLDEDIQQKIEANFNNINHDASTILNLMEEFRNTFADWRYLYEKQASTFSLNYKALYTLVQVLDKTVKEIKPEWK